MSSFKGKIFAIFAVLMMVASSVCVIVCSDGAPLSGNAGKQIDLDFNTLTTDPQDFSDHRTKGNGSAVFTKIDNETAELTLKDFVMVTDDVSAIYIKEYQYRVINIVVEGACVLESRSKNNSYGILSIDTEAGYLQDGLCIYISGKDTDASLKIKTADVTSGTTCGMYSRSGGFEIINLNLNIDVGSADFQGGRSIGISSNYIYKEGLLSAVITDSIVNVKCGCANDSYGILTEQHGAKITGTKTEVTCKAGPASSQCDSTSMGMQLDGKTTIDGAKVVSIAGGITTNPVSVSAFALYTKELNVTNADLRVSCRDFSNGSSYGISADGGKIEKSTIEIKTGSTNVADACCVSICCNYENDPLQITKDCVIKEISMNNTAVSGPSAFNKNRLFCYATIDSSTPNVYGKTYSGQVADPAVLTKPENYVLLATKTHTLIYDTQGGSEIPSAEYAIGEKFKVTDTVPTKDKNIFIEWTDADGNKYQPGDEITMGSSNITLTAHWELGSTVTFDSGTTEVQNPKAQPVLAGKTATEPEISWTDHVFTGWYDKNGNLWDFATVVTENTRLTAHWAEAKQKVDINTDGNGRVKLVIPADSDVTTVTVSNGSVKLTVPEDSVKEIADKSMYITIKEMDAENTFLVTMNYDDGTDFVGLRTISLPYNKDLGDKATVYLRQGGMDTEIQSKLDKTAETLTFDVDRSGTFVVKYTTTPQPEPEPEPEHKESFWDEPGNIAGVAVFAVLILALLGLLAYYRVRKV